jgi:YVTN family beta-propeller protein
VVFDDEEFEVETSVPAGDGIFHMWADPGDNQLWVNNDIDNTATVIDPVTLEVIATVPIPQDLVDLGGKPHDVILDPRGSFAFVTIVGIPGSIDYVVKFSTESFQEVARAAVGKDPHVSLTRRNKLLYVPTQNGNAVYVLKRRDLSVETIIDVPGAHGAGMPRNGRTFYTTNLPGGGVAGLFAIDTKTNTVIGNAVDTPFPVPHNIALTLNGRKLYVTHSGATADKVSIYKIDRKTRLPVFKTDITVGTNPFGLAFVH